MALCEGVLLRCNGEPFEVRFMKNRFMATQMIVGKPTPELCASPE